MSQNAPDIRVIDKAIELLETNQCWFSCVALRGGYGKPIQQEYEYQWMLFNKKLNKEIMPAWWDTTRRHIENRKERIAALKKFKQAMIDAAIIDRAIELVEHRQWGAYTCAALGKATYDILLPQGTPWPSDLRPVLEEHNRITACWRKFNKQNSYQYPSWWNGDFTLKNKELRLSALKEFRKVFFTL